MSVIDDIISGSGDELDLKPSEVVYLKGTEIIINDETGNPIESGLYPYSSGVMDDRRPLIDLHIEPGYFYHGSEEFYLYSRKGTVLGTTRSMSYYNVTGVYPETGLQEVTVSGIIPIPSGMAPHGYSRIGLHGPYSSGEFSSYYQQFINNSGIISLYLNDPPVDSGAYPRRHNPYNPLALCYSGWEENNDKIIRPDLYYYHPGIDAVVYDQAEDHQLYIVEFETSTLPALTGINMSPLNIPTRTGFVVISSDDDIYPIETIQILDVSERSVEGHFIVSAEVFDTHRNLAGLRNIKTRIRQEFKLDTEEAFEPEILQINEYYTIYRIPFNISVQTDIFLNEEYLMTLPPGQQTFIIPTDATFKTDDGATIEATWNSDVNGTVSIPINSGKVPNNERDIIVDFLNDKDETIYTLIVGNRNTNTGVNAVVSEIENPAFRIVEVDRDTEFGKAFVSVSGIKNPQTIRIYTPMELLTYQTVGGLKPSKIINAFSIQEDRIVMEVESPESDGKYLIIETIESNENFIKMNSSVAYGVQ